MLYIPYPFKRCTKCNAEYRDTLYLNRAKPFPIANGVTGKAPVNTKNILRKNGKAINSIDNDMPEKGRERGRRYRQRNPEKFKRLCRKKSCAPCVPYP